MKKEDSLSGKRRVVIEHVRPQLENGRFPIKRVVGESVEVSADVFADGHDVLRAVVLFKDHEAPTWRESPMVHMGNDQWSGTFRADAVGLYSYKVKAWVDHFRTWFHDFRKRQEAGQQLDVHLLMGAEFVDAAAKRAHSAHRATLEDYARVLREGADKEERIRLALSNELEECLALYPDSTRATVSEIDLPLIVERKKIIFSTWYERFPRSCSRIPGKHGTFQECIDVLPEIARMGFDVWYLPPIHPIGRVNRKGKNNSPTSVPDDVGSPWAIGSSEGGHKTIHPALGSFRDFERLIAEAKKLGIDIAMDLAFQCAPDHPYVKEHPEWFRWRPDGTVQHAENPPKRYEDILPLNFESDQWTGLWDELRDVVLFWADKGIRVFRVDNPHTKPFRFWEWLIAECRKKYPELIFLAEAFTRPKVMYQLAKCGFSQSYTYFTWRNTKPEIIDYMTHLLNTEVREFFKPNLWPNTPDILPEHLQFGGRPAFAMRLLLAATLSSNYGIYGPPFELLVNKALPGKEEYADSEKYEIRSWDWDRPGHLKDLIARVNKIRRENEALQTTWNLRFYNVDNEYLLFYGKTNEDYSNIILVVVNLDSHHVQSGWVTVPVKELGIPENQTYLVHELLTEEKFIWHGERNYVELDPHKHPGRIFHVRKRMKRETDFDYYF
jgi:starch synthase (maltosyl-transferring)